jgi:predicted RNA binding protein YcfA (HicA-like mRNA interferase family)
MGKYEKLRQKILQGISDSNVNFSDLCQLLSRLGFEVRVKGDHHIFTKDNIEEIINIQPQSSKAKSYQVKQIRKLLIKYYLGGTNVD